MRIIDADLFIEKVLDGTYIYLQANKEDVVNAVNSEPTIEREYLHEILHTDERIKKG